MKILIIGAVGTGKTTLAQKMSKEYGIKCYEIDSIVHDDLNKRKRSIEEQKDIIKQINTDENWIIEGTLRKNYNLLDMADKIIYLDIPKWKRNIRIFTRHIKQKLRLEHSNYKPNMYLLKKMYEWSNDHEKNKKEFKDLLEEYKEKTTIISKIKTKCIKEDNTMKREKSCGCIVFDGTKVLLVQHLKGHWGFPKGHVEENETEQETAIREVKEETNIDVEIQGDNRYVEEYITDTGIDKQVVYFIAKKIGGDVIAQEAEIKNIEWIEIDAVLEKLTYENVKNLFKKVLKDNNF